MEPSDAPSPRDVLLTLWAYVASIFGSGVTAAVITIYTQPKPWLLLVIGVLLGVVAGILDAFRARAAGMATPASKLAAQLNWLLLVSIFTVWFLVGPQTPMVPLVAVGAFWCVRNLMAFPAVVSLRHSALGQQA